MILITNSVFFFLFFYYYYYYFLMLKCNRYSALDPTGPKPNTIYVYNQPELYIVVVQVTKNTPVRNLHLKAQRKGK